VAKADEGVRWGLQTVVPKDREALPRLLETARAMEQLGFDSLFVMDHPAMHADPYVALSAVAVATERLRLGQLVMAAAYRHPAYVARMQADLDNLSGGRSILGLGSGWFEAEYKMMALDFPGISRRQAGLDEAIAIIDGVWGADPFTFEGEDSQVFGMQIEPAPNRRPPVLVGGSGERGTLRQVAKWGDACNVRETISFSGSPERNRERFAEVEAKFQVLDRHCDDFGRPRNEVLHSHFTTMLILAPTQEKADAKADAIDTSKSTSAGTKSHGRAFLGAASPERAITYYQGLRKIGAEYFIIQVNQDDLETISLLAEEVMPEVG
jgi:alkanesulfonate monooxygenase SsuD/methylene tetrahydromethanopterin reductase-like flavin-dependent oxidoreductase (luciferase family)